MPAWMLPRISPPDGIPNFHALSALFHPWEKATRQTRRPRASNSAFPLKSSHHATLPSNLTFYLLWNYGKGGHSRVENRKMDGWPGCEPRLCEGRTGLCSQHGARAMVTDELQCRIGAHEAATRYFDLGNLLGVDRHHVGRIGCLVHLRCCCCIFEAADLRRNNESDRGS